jgi:threonine/homoserine/homoserine lactone efflux protein
MDKRRDNERRRYAQRRSLQDYGRGILIIGIGLFFMFSKQLFKLEYFEGNELMKYMMGAIFLLYGGFRVWRGKQKDYFRNDEDE